jgi:hypothetical protein
MKNIKEKVDNVVEIAELCPDLYKLECFRLLLQYELNNIQKNSGIGTQIKSDTDESEQRGIATSDLHIKFKSFMDKNNVSIDAVNSLYYFESGSFLSLYDDLKTTKMAEVQIRISLLQALNNAMSTGDFSFDREAVRSECQKRKVYDKRNFTTNFKNNSSLFDNHIEYKKGEQIKLSEKGKGELVKLIGELAQ